MGFEIHYSTETPPSDADILRALRAQYPNKAFGMQGKTIVESYVGQPDYTEVLAHWKRVHSAMGNVATTTTPLADLDRMMSSEL